MTDEQLTYWMAGLLEGEGCFRRTPKGPYIQVGMTDKDVVERVAAIWETSVLLLYPASGNRKACWYTRVYRAKALSWMERVLPHLGERRKAVVLSILPPPLEQDFPGANL